MIRALNQACFVVLAAELAELDAEGTPMGERLRAELEELNGLDRCRLAAFVEGARWARSRPRPAPRPEPDPTPALVADWQRRAARAERAIDVRRAWSFAALALALMLACLYSQAGNLRTANDDADLAARSVR